MEWFLHLSGKAEEGRNYIHRCSPQVGVPAFYVYVSPCTLVPSVMLISRLDYLCFQQTLFSKLLRVLPQWLSFFPC